MRSPVWKYKKKKQKTRKTGIKAKRTEALIPVAAPDLIFHRGQSKINENL